MSIRLYVDNRPAVSFRTKESAEEYQAKQVKNGIDPKRMVVRVTRDKKGE